MTNNKIILCITMILLLQGCAKVNKPAYPADLQMIIAGQGGNGVNENSGAISVSQLMKSVRIGKQPTQANKAPADNWVFKAEQKDLSLHQRKLHLNYHGNAMLPNDAQMAKVRALASQENMQLVSVVIGSCANQSPLACVASAQRRAILLVEKLGAKQPRIEYKPKIGHDVAVVTFERRSS
jgi:hypothetical protein